ncbi:MAG: 3'-5' exonuclease [Solibacillus isronensis]
MTQEFIAVDIETTGTDHIYSGIYEIGAVHIKDGKVVGEFSSYVKTNRPLPLHVLERRGLTSESYKKFPTYQYALSEFLKFTHGKVLVFHNKSFDERFLRYKIRRKLNYDLKNPTLCTLELFKEQIKDFPNYKLGTIATSLGIINNSPHEALNDARVCADIMLCLLGKEPVATIAHTQPTGQASPVSLTELILEES